MNSILSPDPTKGVSLQPVPIHSIKDLKQQFPDTTQFRGAISQSKTRNIGHFYVCSFQDVNTPSVPKLVSCF